MSFDKRALVIAITLMAVVSVKDVRAAEPARVPDLKIGNIAAHTGPIGIYRGYINSAMACLREAQESGELKKNIEFLARNDENKPEKSVELTKRLVEQDKVHVMFGVLSTRSNVAVSDYLAEKKIPNLFIISGSSMFSDPQKFPYTVGWLPLHAHEGSVYAQYILEHLPKAKIGILYQKDGYGPDYLAGIKARLGPQHVKMIVKEVAFDASDNDFDAEISELKQSGADVFINISIGKFAIMALKTAHKIDWKPVHFLPSISNSVQSILLAAGTDASKGVMSATYHKVPDDPRWSRDPGMIAYKAFVKKYLPQQNPDDTIPLIGYLYGQTLVHVLKKAGNDLSRENLLRVSTNIDRLVLPLFLPGVHMTITPDDHSAIKQLQMAKFDGKRWVTFGEVFDGSKVSPK